LPCPGSPPSAASNRPPRQLAPPRRPIRTGDKTPFGASPAERSQVRGRVGVSIQHLLLPPRSLVMKTYPQPDQLGHLRVANPLRYRCGVPYRENSLSRIFTSSPDKPRSHEAVTRAASRISSRKEMRSAAPKVPSIRWASLR
jgi:hypothetical protein